MLIINSLKYFALSFIFVILAGCFGSSAVVKNETIKADAIAANPLPTPKVSTSTWQKAYGEKQALDRNILPKVVATEKPKAPLKITSPAPITDLWQRIRDGYSLSSTELHAAGNPA